MTKFVAIVSGKGGVGKTTATLNIGQALVNQGKKVVLVDANLMTPNLALHLGIINPERTLNQFLRKEKSIQEVTYFHETGISFIPSSPSFTESIKTNPQKLSEIFEHLDDTADFVLIDAPSGLGYEVEQILKHSDEALVVAQPNLSSVTDALKAIQLAQMQNTTIVGVILNMTHRGRHELKTKEVEQILDLPILAQIKDHWKIRKSVHQQLPLNYLYRRSQPAREFAKVAQYISLEGKK